MSGCYIEVRADDAPHEVLGRLEVDDDLLLLMAGLTHVRFACFLALVAPRAEWPSIQKELGIDDEKGGAS